MAEHVSEEQLIIGAQRLIDQLPDQVGELITVLQKEYQLPLWHLVCGILLEVHSEGRLSSFQIDPAWREGLKQKMLRCGNCNKLFKPKWLAQQYCCNECGLKGEGRWVEPPPIEEPMIPPEVKNAVPVQHTRTSAVHDSVKSTPATADPSVDSPLGTVSEKAAGSTGAEWSGSADDLD